MSRSCPALGELDRYSKQGEEGENLTAKLDTTGAVGRSWWSETRPRSQTEVQTAFLCRLKVSKHRLMQITKLRFRPAYTGRCSVPPNRKYGGRQALGLVKRLVRLLRTQGLPISLSAGPRSSTASIWFPLLPSARNWLPRSPRPSALPPSCLGGDRLVSCGTP